ncbi:MAG TPA: chaperone modulator CbpM [Acetobacteraceae bacterium]|nr:chaperone modulator CbpM [Acetobacteraceae bacterium]
MVVSVSLETLCRRAGDLDPVEVEAWVAREWVRPEGERGRYRFREIDVARVRLIRELRQDLRLDEEAVPVVLSLLDQLYATRRRVRLLCDAIERTAPEEVRLRLGEVLRGLSEVE